MPFTPTHITAVLPLVYFTQRLPASALIIGSLIPDLPLFLPLGFSYDVTHSPLGLLTACLPLGLIAYGVFQALLKRPLLALAPPSVQGKLMPWAQPMVGPSLSLWLWVSLSLVIGAGSHVFWDSFTHAGRWGTGLYPAMSTPLDAFGLSWPLFKLAQIGSTLVFLPLLLLLGAGWLKGRTIQPIRGIPRIAPRARWLLGGGLIVLPILGALLWAWLRGATGYGFLGGVIRRGGGLLIVAVVVYGGAASLWRRGRDWAGMGPWL